MKILKKKVKTLKRIVLKKRFWQETLRESCSTGNDEKLVIDLLSLVSATAKKCTV